MADKIEELHKLVDLGVQFMDAVNQTHGSAKIMLGLGYYREDWQETIQDIESLHDRAEHAKNAEDALAHDNALARKSLHLVDIFASAAGQILGNDAFIFLPAAARNGETAQSYADNNAQNMARLCRASLE